MNEKITKQSQPEVKNYKKHGEDAPEAQIAKAKEQLAKNKQEAEQPTAKFDFSNINKTQAKHETKKNIIESAKEDYTKHFSIAKGNKMGSDDSADDDNYQNYDEKPNSDSFNFDNDINQSDDDWNEATNQNKAQVKKHEQEIEILKIKQERPMTWKEADGYFMGLRLNDEKKRIKTVSSNKGFLDKFLSCMNAKLNPQFYDDRDQLFALALLKYSDSITEHTYMLTSIYKIITGKDYCALVG